MSARRRGRQTRWRRRRGGNSVQIGLLNLFRIMHFFDLATATFSLESNVFLAASVSFFNFASCFFNSDAFALAAANRALASSAFFDRSVFWADVMPGALAANFASASSALLSSIATSASSRY